MKNKKIDMLNGPLVGKIVIFALPLALSSILQQLFNSADLAVVGRFDSDKAMAAVGSNSSLVNLIVSLFLGLSVGANVVVARLIGQGRKEKANEAVHTVVLLAVISGFIILGVGEILAPILLGMMNVPDDVLKLATLYLRIFFFAMPFIEIYDFGSAVLRSKGDSTRPLYALITAGVINVILNIIAQMYRFFKSHRQKNPTAETVEFYHIKLDEPYFQRLSAYRQRRTFYHVCP
mgnify:CR=1 FL=1